MGNEGKEFSPQKKKKNNNLETNKLQIGLVATVSFSKKIIPTIYFKTMSSLLDGIQKPKEREKKNGMKHEEYEYALESLKWTKRKLTDIMPTDKIRSLVLLRPTRSYRARLG